MLQLIEVQCPHCGARGQIMVPPIGSMIIGPCPQCQEMVVVFCGQVLALDKDIMQEGNIEERREHLMGVLTDFLQDRVGKLLTEQTPGEDDEAEIMEAEILSDAPDAEVVEDAESDTGPITEAELQRFTAVDLRLLDNDAYFRSVFENK